MATQRISVILPQGWGELTDKQLYYVYSLISDNLSAAQIKAYCFFRWTGIKIVGKSESGWEVRQGKVRGLMQPSLVAAAIGTLDYLDDFPDYPVRIQTVSGSRAVDATLTDPYFPGHKKAEMEEHRFDFGKYLYCDNLYQGYLETQNHALLEEMAQLLYDDEHIRLNQIEKISVFYWWAALKGLFSRTFVNLLTPVNSGVAAMSEDLSRKLQSATNAQIRALTGGDITKHKEVLAMDVWTAMWELDAKAKESAEMAKKYGK